MTRFRFPPEVERGVSLHRRFHQQNKGMAGRTCLRYVDQIRGLYKDVGAKTVLDYGCGKGNQYPELTDATGIPYGDVTLYDPGVKAFARRRTGKFDLVVCVDVLEHVLPKAVPWVLKDLVGYARRGLFITFATVPARKELRPGVNAHLTVKPASWWEEKIATALTAAPAGLVAEVAWREVDENDVLVEGRKRLFVGYDEERPPL